MSSAVIQPASWFGAPSYRQGVLLVLMAGVFWSTMGVAIRSVEAASAWQILFYRSIALSAFLLIVLQLRSGGRAVETIRRAGWPAVIGGLCLVAAFVGGVQAIQLTTVANAMFLFSASPFVAAALGWLLMGERVSGRTWAAMALAGIGVLIMVSEGVSAGRLWGNVWALVSAAGFGCFTIALRWDRGGADMLPAVWFGALFMILTAGALIVWNGESLALSRHDAVVSVSMGVFQIGLGMILCIAGARAVPAAEVALLSLTEVVLGPIWVWALLGETPSRVTLIGGAVLLTALVGKAAAGEGRRIPKTPPTFGG